MGRKILVVEDNDLNLDMITRRLKRKGFSVVAAVNGEEALERAAAEQPDLVLMDLSLPEMDGWEATRRLKSEDATKAIPVIALTAHAMAGDRQRALEAGADEYETKPVDFKRLLEKMNSLLPGE